MDTTVELPDDLVRALDAVAARTGRTRAELLGEAVRAYLRRERSSGGAPDWPRSIGMGEADGPAADAIDEWLATHWEPLNERARS